MWIFLLLIVWSGHGFVSRAVAWPLLLLPATCIATDLGFQFARFPKMRIPDAAVANGLFLTVLLWPTEVTLSLIAVAAVTVGVRHAARVASHPMLNPAAVGVTLAATVFALPQPWHVGFTLNDTVLVAVLGVILWSRALHTWRILVAYFVTNIGFTLGLAYLLAGSQYLPLIVQTTVLGTVPVFYGFFMVTEPRTAPTSRPMMLVFGGLVGFVSAVLPVFLAYHVSFSALGVIVPYLALFAGNVFTFALPSARGVRKPSVRPAPAPSPPASPARAMRAALRPSFGAAFAVVLPNRVSEVRPGATASSGFVASPAARGGLAGQNDSVVRKVESYSPDLSTLSPARGNPTPTGESPTRGTVRPVGPAPGPSESIVRGARSPLLAPKEPRTIPTPASVPARTPRSPPLEIERPQVDESPPLTESQSPLPLATPVGPGLRLRVASMIADADSRATCPLCGGSKPEDALGILCDHCMEEAGVAAESTPTVGSRGPFLNEETTPATSDTLPRSGVVTPPAAPLLTILDRISSRLDHPSALERLGSVLPRLPPPSARGLVRIPPEGDPVRRAGVDGQSRPPFLNDKPATRPSREPVPLVAPTVGEGWKDRTGETNRDTRPSPEAEEAFVPRDRRLWAVAGSNRGER